MKIKIVIALIFVYFATGIFFGYQAYKLNKTGYMCITPFVNRSLDRYQCQTTTRSLTDFILITLLWPLTFS